MVLCKFLKTSPRKVQSNPTKDFWKKNQKAGKCARVIIVYCLITDSFARIVQHTDDDMIPALKNFWSLNVRVRFSSWPLLDLFFCTGNTVDLIIVT